MTETFLIMDTVVTLTVRGENGAAAVGEIRSRLQEIEAMADAHLETSDPGKLRNAAGKHFVPMHEEVFRMLSESQKYSRLTKGAWDITVAPLADLWQRKAAAKMMPTDTEIATARGLVDWEKLWLDEKNHAAYLSKQGMAIDLGGLAKGFALDEIKRILQKYGINSALVNMGASSIYARGSRDKQNWRIGIRNPRADAPNEIVARLPLKDAMLSTSGDYERSAKIGEFWYHHVIDPRSGYPAKSGAISATVIMDDSFPNAGMLTDILSTTLLILGSESGADLLPVRSASAIIINNRSDMVFVGEPQVEVASE